MFILAGLLDSSCLPDLLVEEKAGLCAFCAFVCFAHVGLYLFPILLSVRDWLRRVIVALPGLFFYLFDITAI